VKTITHGYWRNRVESHFSNKNLWTFRKSIGCLVLRMCGNIRFREFYDDRFLDLMAMVTDDEGIVWVFTSDHRFISADGKHFTKLERAISRV